MNPTFTPDPPTKPGWYLWRTSYPSIGIPIQHLVEVDEEMTVISLTADYKPVNEIGGLWCRLVPAEEVERAFMDGHARGISGTSLTSNERRDALAIDWFNSRAKRVMEGEV